MAEGSESDREQLARDISQELDALSAQDAVGYRAVARRLADAGITASMAEGPTPVGDGKTRLDRLEHALATALVDLEAGPLGDAAVEGYDQETLTYNIRNLTYTAHTFEFVWVN